MFDAATLHHNFDVCWDGRFLPEPEEDFVLLLKIGPEIRNLVVIEWKVGVVELTFVIAIWYVIIYETFDRLEW